MADDGSLSCANEYHTGPFVDVLASQPGRPLKSMLLIWRGISQIYDSIVSCVNIALDKHTSPQSAEKYHTRLQICVFHGGGVSTLVLVRSKWSIQGGRIVHSWLLIIPSYCTQRV